MSSKRRVGCVVLLLLISLCAGCGERPPSLLLFCGAGIRPPVDEAAKLFGQEHGVTIECDYAGSETLLSRIKLSGRGDLYMPGDVHYVDLAHDAGLLDRSETVCYFVPVVMVQKGNPKQIQSLADLTAEGIELGLGDPRSCAIGRKSAKLFEKNGITAEAIDQRVVFRSGTVNELGIHVEAGTIDAAIVWDAEAEKYADSTDVVAIPTADNVISTVAVGVLTSSEQPELADKFVEFITSDRAIEIFNKHHYTTTRPE